MTQLQTLIAHAYKTVPFYRDRLAELAALPTGALTMEHLRTLPLLTRSNIQEAGSTLFTSALPKSHGQTFSIRTSGSTGRPVEIQGTSLTGLFFQALGLRYHLWHRRDFSAKAVTFRAMKPGETSKRYRGWAAGIATGPALVFNHSLPARELFDILLKENPAYLQVHPSTLRELIRISLERGVFPEKLREVRTVSEVLEPDLRALCGTHWNVAVANNYSCEEVNIMALQCPEYPHFHVQSENCLIEILDDDGNACEPGQLGRTVITALNNYASPLIRYENGDMAEPGEPCLCGRGMPVLTRIAGRVRNLAILPNGEKVTPSLATEDILNRLPVTQFQLIQKSLENIEAKLAVTRPLRPEEEAQIADFFNRGLGHTFAFTFTYVNEIPRPANGKFEIFRCEVPT